MLLQAGRTDVRSPQAYQLSLSAGPFLRTFQSALVRTIALGKVELNDLALSPDGKQLAWCGDDGRVGLRESCRASSELKGARTDRTPSSFVLVTVDLKTESKTWMKGKHANVRFLRLSYSRNARS